MRGLSRVRLERRAGDESVFDGGGRISLLAGRGEGEGMSVCRQGSRDLDDDDDDDERSLVVD